MIELFIIDWYLLIELVTVEWFITNSTWLMRVNKGVIINESSMSGVNHLSINRQLTWSLFKCFDEY